MRVLVTGLQGFTGRYARQALEAAGHTVTGLSSDLRDAAAVRDEIDAKRPEAVMHLAAQAFVGHDQANEFYEVNLIGAKNLLTALANKAPGIKSILLASSANIYGNQTGGAIGEDTMVGGDIL